MELLLVIAIIAVVAGIGAPQFFRASGNTLRDTRMAEVRTNFMMITQAIRDQISWEKSQETPPVGRVLASGAGVGAANVALLVSNGFIQKTAARYSRSDGSEGAFSVEMKTSDPGQPFFLQQFCGYHVLANGFDITVAVEKGISWNEIWSSL